MSSSNLVLTQQRMLLLYPASVFKRSYMPHELHTLDRIETLLFSKCSLTLTLGALIVIAWYTAETGAKGTGSTPSPRAGYKGHVHKDKTGRSVHVTWGLFLNQFLIVQSSFLFLNQPSFFLGYVRVQSLFAFVHSSIHDE